jgi:hypothetical protein
VVGEVGVHGAGGVGGDESAAGAGVEDAAWSGEVVMPPVAVAATSMTMSEECLVSRQTRPSSERPDTTRLATLRQVGKLTLEVVGGVRSQG